MLFSRYETSLSQWLNEQIQELQFFQQRKMSLITDNEYRLGKNITGLLLLLSNALFFSAFQILNFCRIAVELPHLFAFCYILGVFTAFEVVAIVFLISVRNSFLNSIFTSYSFMRTFLDPIVMDIPEDQDNTINQYPFRRFLNAVLNVPLELMHRVDSIIPAYLLSKRDAWGAQTTKLLYGLYFVIKTTAVVLATMFYSPLRIVLTLHEARLVSFIYSVATIITPVLAQAAFLAPFIGVMMLNMSLGVIASSLAMFVANETIKKEVFAQDAVNPHTREQRVQTTNNLVAAINNNQGATILSLYKQYEATDESAAGLIKNNSEVFRAISRSRNNFVGIPGNFEEENSPIKICMITQDTCQHPVYVRSIIPDRAGNNQEHRHYYDLYALLTWLRDHRTNPASGLPITLDDIYYDEEAKQALDSLIETTRQGNLIAQQQQPVGNASVTQQQNADVTCFQRLFGMSRQPTQLPPNEQPFQDIQFIRAERVAPSL